jgi:hypothetical protein
MAVNTLRKHVDAAVASGWLGRESRQGSGKGWKLHVYQTAVPDSVQLSEKDEQLTDILAAQVEPIPDVYQPIADTPSITLATYRDPGRVSNDASVVCQTGADRVSNSANGVSGVLIQKFSPEVLITPVREKGAALTRNTAISEIDLKKKIQKLNRAGMQAHAIVSALSQYGVTIEQVRRRVQSHEA